MIRDLPDFAVERNMKSEIGLVTFRKRLQYAILDSLSRNEVFSADLQIMRLYRAEFCGRQFE